MGLTALEPKRAPLRSTAASVAFHALLALAIPSFAWTISQNPQVETISFTRVAVVHVATPKPVIRAEPPAAAPRRAASVHLQPRLTTPKERVQQHALLHVVQRASIPAQGAPAVAAVVRGSGSAPAADSSAMPQPVPTDPPRQIASVEHHGPPGGYLPLGAEEAAPVLDPAVRSAIANLGVHTTLTVVVDEDGKTKSVAFAPDVDAATETRIREMLVNATWDPSVCGGGVSCQGQAVIRL